ncbi:MAG: 23S rRNA (uracil(1939)-C(5))-methyltransferase RlmD [Candidatus Aminicenantales bacterium]
MTVDQLGETEVILASRSPRRQELLKKIRVAFQVVPSGVDENKFRENDPLRFALGAAEAKARDVGEKHPSSLIIAADTVVNLGDEVFGKPGDRTEAREILRRLSGRRHRVITAVALFRKEEERLLTGYEISYVTFRTLSDQEINGYLASSEFLDKAGSYAVQEVGDAFVEKLEGDYENVVGFPVARVKKLLDEFLDPGEIVSITDIALPHDWGVGKINGMVTFVPGAVVGDKVRVIAFKEKRRHRFGRIVKLESASPFRVEPACPHFGTCGGCAFQNLAYAKQLEIKESYLLRTLRRIGRLSLDGVEHEPITPSPSPYFYRNKMEFAFGGDENGIFLGLRERASPLEKYKRRTVALRTCPIFSRAVEEIFPVLMDCVGRSGMVAYDPLTKSGYFRNLVLREGKNTGEILAVLVTRSGKEFDPGEVAQELMKTAPQVKSFWWVENDRIPDLVDFEKKTHIAGSAFIEERLGEFRFRIYPETFFQPNPQGAEKLYGQIHAEVRALGAQRALGLYCGSGSIEISISGAAEEVVGIDSERANIAVAGENAALNGVRNCRFIKGRVERFLKEEKFPDFDALVLDPPRAGISARALKHIISLKISPILYVSCNPAAFARDIGLLEANGYRLRKLGCFDFFPHTPHLEALGVLEKT